MPYTKTNIPDTIKSLPEHAQEIFIASYNSAYKQYDGDEEKSNAVAWSAVKTKYKKVDDKWVTKELNHSEFKELSKWWPIFYGGIQTDSNGREVDGDELIQSAIENFDVDVHEPPIRLTHEDNGGPAYGWIKNIKSKKLNGGNALYAKMTLTDEMIDLLKSEKYKKRSAGFRKGKLHHLAMLGNSVPAVKSLPNIDLDLDDGNNDMYIFNFEELKMPKIQETENKEVMFSEEIVNTKLTEQKQNLVKEFNEKLDSQKKEYENKIKDINFAQQKNEIKVFLDNLIKDGKITPAIMDSGVQDFCESLLDDLTFNFNEKSLSKIEWFKNFLSGGDNSGLFTEFDNSKDRLPDGVNDKQELLIKEKRKEDSSLNYSEALKCVALENRELFNQ